jgi:hypothetical protein
MVVAALRDKGHEVYDFRNPKPGNTGFQWSAIDPTWQSWSPPRFCEALTHRVAIDGYKLDKEGLDWCDVGVLLLPCGRSAHLEAGYLIGQGKPTIIVLSRAQFEPELMYLLADRVVCSIEDLLTMLRKI